MVRAIDRLKHHVKNRRELPTAIKKLERQRDKIENQIGILNDLNHSARLIDTFIGDKPVQVEEETIIYGKRFQITEYRPAGVNLHMKQHIKLYPNAHTSKGSGWNRTSATEWHLNIYNYDDRTEITLMLGIKDYEVGKQLCREYIEHGTICGEVPKSSHDRIVELAYQSKYDIVELL